jgi:DNA-binding NarL/FixJ family response regulator
VRVLLVEDSAALERELRQALAAVGFEVAHAAATRQDAVRWLAMREAEWDLAVVDIFLREGHGFDVLRACSDRCARQRVVVLTNYTREPVRTSARALGADAVFDKSYEIEDFIAYCASFAAATNSQFGGQATPTSGRP